MAEAVRSDSGSGVQEFQLEAKHLVFLILLVVVLCVASFMFGRWVERQSLGPSLASVSSGRDSAKVEEMGDVSKELTFFDTLKEGQQAPLVTDGAPGTQGTSGRRSAAVPVAPRSLAPAPSAQSSASRALMSQTTSPRRSVNEGVMIQVLASKNRAAADAVRKKLRAKGYTALVITEGGFYKVRVGPYADREEAQRAAAVLRSEENLETRIL